jgi:hypothetical protein
LTASRLLVETLEVYFFYYSVSRILSFEEVVNECYQDAREQAADETELPLDTFPQESPFTLAEVLNPDYLPQD